MTSRLPLELCQEDAVESFAGTAYMQKWWSHTEHAEMLRFTRASAGDAQPAEDSLIREAELVGLLDAAWQGGLLSDFVKRQLFQLIIRRYEQDPAGTWAAGPTTWDD